MCGRFTLKTPIPEIAELFEVDRVAERELPPPRFNVAPSQAIAAIRRSEVDGARELALLRWGLVPAWAKQPADWPNLINARAESLERKPAFRDSFRDRRCLVVADGFYEWRAEGGGKQPYYVRLKSGRPLAFAALWDRWVPPGEGAPLESCTVVTTDANDLLKAIHDRMPAILPPEGLAIWLDPAPHAAAELTRLLQPFPSDALEIYPVTRRMSRPDFDEAACIEPLPEDPASSAAPSSGEPAEPANRPPARPADQLRLL